MAVWIYSVMQCDSLWKTSSSSSYCPGQASKLALVQHHTSSMTKRLQFNQKSPRRDNQCWAANSQRSKRTKINRIHCRFNLIKSVEKILEFSLTKSNIRFHRIIPAIIDPAGNSDAHLAIRGERIPSLPAATSDAAIWHFQSSRAHLCH